MPNLESEKRRRNTEAARRSRMKREQLVHRLEEAIKGQSATIAEYQQNAQQQKQRESVLLDTLKSMSDSLIRAYHELQTMKIRCEAWDNLVTKPGANLNVTLFPGEAVTNTNTYIS